MEKAPVTVVVITKNEEEMLEDCLKSAQWADEIIVVDDASTDNSIQLLEKKFPQVKILKNKTNLTPNMEVSFGN